MAVSNATILKREKLRETISPAILTLRESGWIMSFPDSRISRNIIHHNGTHGIFLEMSNYEFDQLLVDHNLIFENQMDAVYIHDASGATFSHNLISDSSSPSSGGQLVRIQQVSHRASTANHSFFHNLFVGRLAKIETNYPEFLSGLQRFDFNGYGFQ